MSLTQDQQMCFDRPMVLIGAVIKQATSTQLLARIQPDLILATEFLTVRNEQTTGAINRWQDMDLLKVIVSADHAERIFDEIFCLADIENTEGAYMYQHGLTRCSRYQLPLLPPEGVPTEVLDDVSLANEFGLSEIEIQNLRRLVENQA
jgi:hypothetical protein